MNNRGALTLDFIFALVLVGGLTGILMALSLTLVVVEVSQYIAFATSRAHFAGHLDEQKQAELGDAKFEQLKSEKGIRGLFTNGWFTISKVSGFDFRDEYDDQDPTINTFVGAKLTLEAKVLDFKIPFYGSTAPDGNSFKAGVNSFLGREPSFQECYEFEKNRWEQIKQLDSRFEAAAQFVQGDPYKVITDNGC